MFDNVPELGAGEFSFLFADIFRACCLAWMFLGHFLWKKWHVIPPLLISLRALFMCFFYL